MRRPGVHAQHLAHAAHQQAALRSAGPHGLQLGRRRKRGAQAHLEGDGRHLAHAEIGEGLVHRLHPAAQAVERGVDRLHDGGGQGHVGLDQRGHGLQIDVLGRHQQRELDQHLGLGRNLDVQIAQLRVDGHGGN